MRKLSAVQNAFMGRALVYLLLLAWVPVQAADFLRFKTVALDEGLSQLSVISVYQDPQGFMWLGTQAGLNRYDGYDFKVYKRVFGGETNSLSDNYIHAIAGTADGDLWLGTGSGGLNHFDPRLERFTVHRNDPEDATSISNDEVRSVAVAAGQIWAGTAGGGLNALNPATGDFRRWEGAPGGSIVNALLVIDERLWIGTDSGLVGLNLVDESWMETPVGADRHVTALAAMPDGTLWVGTQDGLVALDPRTGRTRNYYHIAGDPDSLAFDQIEALLVDDSGLLWIGTTNGLSRFDPGENRFSSFYHDPGDDGSLASNRVVSMLQDRTGILWFGTWTGGASRLNPAAVTFRGYRDGPLSLADSRVRDFHEAADGTLWVATLGGGLSHFDPDRETFRNYRHIPGDATTIGSDELHAVEADRDGFLWIGSRNAGISRFDPESGYAWRYPHRNNDPGSPAGDHILSLLVDSQNRLWIGTRDDGVSVLDIDTWSWRHYRLDPGDPNSLSSDTIGYIFESSDGQIWLGTRGAGFNIFRPESDDFLRIGPRPGSPSGLTHGSITFFSEDSAGEIWLGTQGGGFGRIVSAGPAAADFSFEFINSAHGLPSDAIGATLIDDAGRVWVSTLVGISSYTPANGTLENFFPVHGTQKRAYYVGSGLHASDGTLYFGGLEGITRFKPVTFPIDEFPPQVSITDFMIANRSVEPGEEGLVDVAPRFMESVELTYRQDIFSFQFAGLHFAQPEQNRYQYQLVGFDTAWVETPATRRIATYTNLDPGHYRFRVRASNRDGVWAEPVEVALRVHPAPWRTPLAYAGYLGLALALFGLVSWTRFRQRAARRAAEKAIRESEERLKLALWGSGDEMWYLDVPSGAIERLSYGRQMEIRTQRPVDSLAVLLDQMHEEDRPAVEAALNTHLRGGSPYFEATYRIKGREGQWLWALAKGRVVETDAGGRPQTVAGATKDVTQLKNTERALRELNERLESMVDERTDDLQRANSDLKRTLDMLTDAQTQLVESEKMASLGNLVAGIAHEINTPVGVALTAATYMQGQIRRALNQVDSEDGEAELDLRDVFNKERKNVEFLIQNLNRAAELIRSFKQVAVDQSSEERRAFKMAAYLEEILTSLHPKLKKTNHEVNVECDEDLELESYPGALYQVITNLVMNSLIHGFQGVDAGEIRIEVSHQGNVVRINYQDDGRGFGPEVQERIFEPFYTTRRGSGGSGLGMHIVYNLVTQVLRGRIRITGAPGEGVKIMIEIPRVIEVEAPA
ncbi:MAG: two-component regulator propeller domain-containing protein [Xanthomonadales bacterium]|nr:two-component regulator propeller domain-containing protein [Xanthomonadales bacterium]